MIQFTGADLALRFRELTGLDEGAVQACLQGARSYVDEAEFGADAREALMLYTAHLIALGDPSRRAGVAVSEERVGDVNRRYAQDPNSDETDMSGYLIQWRRLANKHEIGGFAGGGAGCL